MSGDLLIGTSWKMNLTPTGADGWFRTLLPLVADLPGRRLFVLPPYPAIWVARQHLLGGPVAWGAQDVHPDDDGAHTGDVSAAMLADLGCTIVEVGHSERRRDHGETPALIARKVAAVLRWGMRPLLCTGETERRSSAEVLDELRADLAACLRAVADGDRSRVMIAYEPVWAIGSGASAASPEHVDRIHAGLHDWLDGWSDGAAIPVLYGGSVDASEAGRLLARPGVDGLFVGRHALDPHGFARIARAGTGDDE